MYSSVSLGLGAGVTTGMERTLDRKQKQDFIADLNGALGKASTIVVTHYSGLTVAEISKLRKQMRDVGAFFKVTKNTLALRAVEGTDFEAVGPMFTGPTAIAYSEDPVAPAKVAMEFAKTNPKLVIIGGAFGTQMLDADGVKAIATLPSLDELRGKLVGLLQAPATKIAGVLQAPAGQVARVLSAYAEKGEAA